MNWKGTRDGKAIYGFDISNRRMLNVRNIAGIICQIPKPIRYTGQDERYEQELEEAKANQELIADAFNTIQLCDKMPSELLKDNTELVAIQNVLTVGKNSLHSDLVEAADRLKTALAILNEVTIPSSLMETYGNLAMNAAELINTIENGQ